jgi:hypothetical protein
MRGGVKALWVTAGLAAAGCAAGPGEFKIREIADSGTKLRSSSAPLAEARAMLALGNAGLALEGFRKALRERPDSVDALVGIAACYEQMGRYDLARKNYERALALTPRDPVLLNTLAALLQRQGKPAMAAQFRSEAAQLAAASAALDDAESEPEPELAAPAPIVQPKPPSTGAAVTSALAQPRIASPAPAPSVTVALPPARPAVSADSAVKPVMPPAPSPVAMPRPDIEAFAHVGIESGPRLERLSAGEVALVTTEQPIWRPQVVARTARSTTVKWVPIQASAPRPSIRLLNAARRQGIAARHRAYLLNRGWRKIEIGDADQVRERSVVLYSAGRQKLGRSLAAQFGFASRKLAYGDALIVLIGRDATTRTQQKRG